MQEQRCMTMAKRCLTMAKKESKSNTRKIRYTCQNQKQDLRIRGKEKEPHLISDRLTNKGTSTGEDL